MTNEVLKIAEDSIPESVAHVKKRGFTLTEIAIVLGIIGLILGAIWVAASAVYNNMNVSKATTELLQITQAVRNMYGTAPAVDSAMTATSYIKAGVFPSDTTAAGTATVASNPWGGAITITASTVNNTNDAFVVTFAGLPQAACITFATSNTGSSRDSGMGGAAIGTATGNTANVAVTYNANFNGINASTATTSCTSTSSGLAGGNAIGFLFRLKG